MLTEFFMNDQKVKAALRAELIKVIQDKAFVGGLKKALYTALEAEVEQCGNDLLDSVWKDIENAVIREFKQNVKITIVPNTDVKQKNEI